MFKTCFLAFVVSVLTALPAAAENWVLVARGEGETDYYIDAESVQEASNGTYLFWRMSVSSKPDEKGVVATKTYISISCPLQGWRRKAYASFNAQGELVNREEFSDTEPLQFFTSGSVGEALWKFVCKPSG